MHRTTAMSRLLRTWHRLPLLLIGSLLATGCGKANRSAPPPPAPEVATLSVSARRVVLTRELPGRTSPFLVAEIRPQASGIIQNRRFTEGTDVKEGDVLYEIDPSSYQAAVANATAAVAVAKANHGTAQAAVAAAQANQATAQAAHEAAQASLAAAKANRSRAEANAVPLRLRVTRFGDLVANKAISQQDFDDASAALKQAEAGIESAAAAVQAAQADVRRAEAAVQVTAADTQRTEAAVQAAQAAITSAEAILEAARINLGYTRIKAPIHGRIGRSAVTTGALVTAHQPVALAVIQQLDPIYVDVPQATADLLRLQRRLTDGRLSRNGTQNVVKLNLEDGKPYTHEGTLQFRDVTVDPSTGSFILRVVFPNPDRVLLPGMFVRTLIEEGSKDQAILIMQQAVSRDPQGNPFVMLVDAAGKAERRMLSLDRAMGNQWLVTAGLAVGDRVIVEGLQRVRPGIPVRAVPLSDGQPETSPGKANESPEKAN